LPTSLKLPAELRERIQALVAGTGQSVHAFMLQAIEREASYAETRQELVAAALVARADFAATRTGYRAADVHEHFRARARGAKPKRLKVTRWRR
jgi:predicted transcriptional regulator